jgi:hypothetical protein
LASDLDAVQVWKANVEEDQVRLQFFRLPDGFESIGH